MKDKRFIIASPRVTTKYPLSQEKDYGNWLVNVINGGAGSQETAYIKESNSDSAYVGDWHQIANKFAALSKWIQLVKSDGVWDFKPDIQKAHLPDTIRIGGIKMSSQALANIAYGYIGNKAGFNFIELEGGAGAAQIQSWGVLGKNAGSPFTFMDQPHDNAAIRLGMLLAQSKDPLSVDLINQYAGWFIQSGDLIDPAAHESPDPPYNILPPQ